ncbi:MAG: SPASM domain-containing protein [Deltaproteobacteria bacterium]|nr:SPASM domain-containing protein [Deltaproteobacteria bacterium]
MKDSGRRSPKVSNIERYGEIKATMARGGCADISHLPIELFIEPTKHCNLKCRMCCHKEMLAAARRRQPEGPIHFGREDFDALLPLMNDAAILYGVGVGEPLLNPALPTFVRTASDFGLFTWITTNGMPLGRELASALAEARLGRLMFSISAGKQETYEAVHRGAKWSRLWEAWGYYQDALASCGLIGEVFANFVVQHDNLEELPLLAHRLTEDFALGMSVKPIADIGGIDAPAAYHRPYTPVTDDPILREARSILDAAGMIFEDDNFTSTHRFDEQRHGICVHPFKTLYVNVFGDAYPCCFGDVFEPKALCLGSLRAHTAKELWFGDRAKRIRTRILGQDYLPGCRKCIAANLNGLHNDKRDEIADYSALVYKSHAKLSRAGMESSGLSAERHSLSSSLPPTTLWGNGLSRHWATNNEVLISDGQLTSLGKDPFIISPPFSADPGEVRVIKIVMETTAPGTETMQLFWTYEGDEDFSEAQSVRLSYGKVGDAGSHTIYFDLSFTVSWCDNRSITRLRIDPCERPGRVVLTDVLVY